MDHDSDSSNGLEEAATDAAEQERALPANTAAHPLLELTSGDRQFLLVASGLILICLSVYAWRLSNGGRETIEIQHLADAEYTYKLDMNSATWVEWMQLEGVGDVLARRIVDDRERNGPFRDIDDLDRVKGIGPATLERLRPHLFVDP